MESNEPIEAVMVRMPLVMKRRLQQIARANRRSLSAQCQLLLELTLPDPLALPQESEQ